MDRRSFISGAAAASLALAATARAEEHKHGHDHGAAAANPNDAVVKATAACIAAGRACLAHCIRLLSEGDKSMANCAKAANQMLALCDATNSLAAQQSALLPAFAKLCADACKQCADACKEHADHHAECKACFEACNDCAEQCGKIAA